LLSPSASSFSWKAADDTKDVFLNIHEHMISEDQYQGRQLLLSQTFDEVSIENLALSDRANISRAIAMYDTLGLYLRRGYLIEDDVIEMWGNAAYRAWCKAQPFVERRTKRTGLPAYPNFRYLAERGGHYKGNSTGR
jgi:hypothetical protein